MGSFAELSAVASADRSASIAQLIRSRKLEIAIAACLCAAGATASAQAAASAPPPAPVAATYTGCVQKAPDSTLVISAPNACARLTGKLAADSDTLTGHQIELKGILTPRTPDVAASIQVNSIISVGKSCSDVCALHPPGTRGLHRPDGAVPGSEGGTPGAAPPPH